MKILVVEDEVRIASQLKKGLEQERYNVQLSHDGIEGYDLASTEEFDLIILDLMLPGKDGLTICRELRRQHVSTPILMLTAKAQITDRVTGLDLGADDYLTKPFAFDELFARVRALTRRPPQLNHATLRVGDLELDPQAFTVSRHQTPLQLSQKEFMILKYLMRQAGQIVTKDKIMSQVWDYDADILPNTVEAYIKNLRKKIDVPFPDLPPLIKTVRGFGYKLDAQ